MGIIGRARSALVTRLHSYFATRASRKNIRDHWKYGRFIVTASTYSQIKGQDCSRYNLSAGLQPGKIMDYRPEEVDLCAERNPYVGKPIENGKPTIRTVNYDQPEAKPGVVARALRFLLRI